MNLFGVDVAHLDVPVFLFGARTLFPVIALAWLGLVVRVRRPGWLLAGVLLGNAYVWFETNWPLQRLYALGPSNDRLNNLAMCQAVAAGGPLLRTAQVGHMQFEPFWSVFTSVLSGFDPVRLMRLYGFLSLFIACGFGASVYAAMRPRGDDAGRTAWSPWERALIAGFATLLSSAAMDWTGPYRVPWAMTFLLKPNHALGLVMVPWVVRAVAQARRGRDRLLAGVLLHLLGWMFVIHMGAVCVGLVTYAVLVTIWHRDEARAAWRDVGVPIGINVLVVSPYLFMLFSGYSVFQRGPRLQIPPTSPHLLEATTRTALLAVLAAWGAILLFRRDRLGRFWCGQAVGALLIWLSYYPLHYFQLAKERDDTYYWLRVNLAICAAVAAWDLAGRVARRLRMPSHEAVRAAVLAAAFMPASVPSWWDPSRMDLYFAASLAPVPARYVDTVAHLRGDRRAVLAGDPAAARWMAALSGTRVLLAQDFPKPRDWTARLEYSNGVVRGTVADPLAAGASWGVTHLIVTPTFLAVNGVSLHDLEARSVLRPTALTRDGDGEYVALFALVAPPS